jgi:tetratricopeptide (TPR) repeat protein
MNKNMGLISGSLLILSFMVLSGCQTTDLVHQRPMAELNQKAQTMMQAGDFNGAIARLESAHDLDPSEPNTTFNLALAYQAAGRIEPAIGLLADLADKPKAGGPSSAQVHKALAVTWEAKADQLASQAKDASPESGDEESKSAKQAKPPSADAMQKQEDAERAYATALDYYKQALKEGLQDPQVQQQVQMLEDRRAKPSNTSVN